MLKKTILAFLFAVCLNSISFAQQTNTGDTGNAAAGGDQIGLDAAEVFDNVERGDTIGATGSTGQGFSSLSAANGGGGGGGGALGGGGGFGGFGGLGGFGSLFGNTQASQNSTPIIRTRIRSAVQVAPTPPRQVQQQVTGRLRALPTQSPVRNLNVQMQGRTAVVSGVVNSERDRRMSELLLMLEPGVRSVENRVMIQP